MRLAIKIIAAKYPAAKNKLVYSLAAKCKDTINFLFGYHSKIIQESSCIIFGCKNAEYCYFCILWTTMQ